MKPSADQAASIPRHVAIIMDGNGRWAQKRMMPRFMGHRAGARAVRRTVRACAERGVEVLTLFAFSTENWQRPQEEVSSLMQLFLDALEKESRLLDENDIRLRVIGKRDGFNQAIRDAIERAEALTRGNRRMVLNVAANYGGRWDIVQAVQAWCEAHPEAEVHQLTPEVLAQYLSTGGQPDPDLLIRTGGEQRISNFLIWQLAYTELYFTDVLWPDFSEEDLEAAFSDYATRQRRFGRVPASSDGQVHPPRS